MCEFQKISHLRGLMLETRSRMLAFQKLAERLDDVPGLGGSELFGYSEQLQELEKEYTRHLVAMLEELEAIPDVVVRRIAYLRYMDGLSWVQISLRLGYSSASGARMALSRYLVENAQK